MRKMSYLLLIIILIKSKEIEDTCSFYNINNSITECLDQAGPFPHYFCCGLNISYAETKVSRCFPIQGSKPAVDILRDQLLEQYSEYNATLDLICPDKYDEIEGTCDEFYGFMVDDENKCLQLSVNDDSTDKRGNPATCCGVKIKYDHKIDRFPFVNNTKICIPLPKDKELRDKALKEIIEPYNTTGSGISITSKCINIGNILSIYRLGFILFILFLL